MVDIYEVRITEQAQNQMKEIVDYISYELFAPEAATSVYTGGSSLSLIY